MEKPETSVTAKPPEGSDTCRGLAPSFLNVISCVLIRAVRSLGTGLLVALSPINR